MTHTAALGIDTSNYTTSVSLVVDGEVISNRKSPLPVADGQRGLRQSDAVFAHTKNLPALTDLIGADIAAAGVKINAIGVSRAPRDGEESYMPCFLVGIAAAHAASSVTGAPIYEFSHQAGHITAALYSAGRLDLLDGIEPFAAFHVSGGTTDVTVVTPRCGGLDVERIGGSDDLHAGQLIDRVGVMMGMRFPCGPELEKAAACVPVSLSMKTSVRGVYCSMSGAENKAAEIFRETGDVSAAASYTLDFVTVTLDKMTRALRESYASIPIIYSGGVMSCRRMRETLGVRDGVWFAEPEFSSDNAAGTALLAYRKHMGK